MILEKTFEFNGVEFVLEQSESKRVCVLFGHDRTAYLSPQYENDVPLLERLGFLVQNNEPETAVTAETAYQDPLDQLSREELIQLIHKERSEASHTLAHTTKELDFLRKAIQVLNTVAQTNWRAPLSEKIFHITFDDKELEKIVMEEYNKLKEEKAQWSPSS